MDQRLTEPAGGASVDWRGRCEELADALACHYPGHVDDVELVNRVRADLAEPEPERYCQMIVDVQALAKRWSLPAPWLGKLVSEVLADAAGIEGLKKPSIPPALPDFEARAVLSRYGHQSAPPAGELLKEAAWLRNECSAENADGNWISMSIDQALDLASLLERQVAPLPDRLPELRGMFERILCVARSSDQKPVGNIELADRLIKAVVSWGASGAALAVKPVGEVE